MKKIATLVLVILTYQLPVFSQLQLAGIFSDNMVLQRGEGTRVWGQANPGAEIKLSLGSVQTKCLSDKDGFWEASFPALSAGGPFAMTVKAGREKLTLTNILIGDVYMASGQSNMEWWIKNGIDTPDEVHVQPLLRYAKVPRKAAAEPMKDATLTWREATDEQLGTFSAVAYFFAKKVIEETGVPIGIVENAIGGSPVEAWISSDHLRTTRAYGSRLRELEEGSDLRDIKKQDSLMKMSKSTAEVFRATTDFESLLTDINDVDWSPIALPSSLERAGLYIFDGNIWLKKEFHLKEVPTDSMMVSLGVLDDSDHTFLNGHHIGSSTGEDVSRKYTVAAEHFRPGTNTLLIYLNDQHYIGGAIGPEEEMYLEPKQNERATKVSLSGEWAYFYQEEERICPYYHKPFYEPTALYNAQIHPFVRMNMAGILWYQGESNSGRGEQYRELFPMMINDWRVRMKSGYLPFYFVQLPRFKERSDSKEFDLWAELREAQLMALNQPNTGMAITIDLGDAKNIHPGDKQPVGERLAFLALHDIYGKDVVRSGPLYRSHEIRGDSVFIHFDESEDGLKLDIEQDQPNGFIIAGADGKFYPAQVKLVGDSQLVVWSEQVTKPEAVRYAWASNPYISLFNKSGLPAAPFRTDHWLMKSQNR